MITAKNKSLFFQVQNTCLLSPIVTDRFLVVSFTFSTVLYVHRASLQNSLNFIDFPLSIKIQLVNADNVIMAIHISSAKVFLMEIAKKCVNPHDVFTSLAKIGRKI